MLVQVSPGAMRCIAVARASITNLLNNIEFTELLIWVMDVLQNVLMELNIVY